jgi:hypothetical protein
VKVAHQLGLKITCLVGTEQISYLIGIVLEIIEFAAAGLQIAREFVGSGAHRP